MTQFPHLFSPIRIGAREARNRVMRLATVTNTGGNGIATERTIAHYRTIARGGVGIVVTEAMRVHPSNAGRTAAMMLYRKEILPSLRALADTVHGEGALLVAQINHGGRQHHAHEIPTVWGPSAIACPQSGGVPHVMTRAEIAEVVDGFATAAANAKLAGCAGVEVHGAQGHLVQQFVSPFSNRREDEYGGSLENRLRFAKEILGAIRDRVGRDFIVGYRMGVHEFSPGGITVEDSKLAAVSLAALGAIDYFSLAQGNFHSIDAHLPDAHYPHLPYADMQAQVRAVVPGIPVVTSSRIQTPDEAESLLAQGKADMVGLCRALIADDEWARKAQAGRAGDIRRCISCNRCWALVVDSKRVGCTINATFGFEGELPAAEPAKTARKVVIVGGGAAGLEAARVAAGRGHRVTLFEKSGRLGGKLNFGHHYEPYHELGHALDHMVRPAALAGIDVRTGTAATLERVLAEQPDAVIVATGSQIVAPELPGDGSVKAVVYSRVPAGASVVVMDEDGYFWASAMTEQLARRGCRVVYATRFHEPFRELPQTTRISTLRVLDELGVSLRPTMAVDRVERGAVVLQHYYNPKHEERIEAAEVVWIGMQQVDDTLAEGLRAAGVADVRVIGDAYMARRLTQAIAEGYRAGLTV
jgi:2,4-dienoyl-CoA reductase-like NADH-dependent reductase (Old Yellow Enzyme family)